MTADPAIVLDISRLLSRLGLGPATGIDRVEAEWLTHLQARPHLLLCRVRRGQLLLPPRAGTRLLGWMRGEGIAALPGPDLLDRLRGRRDLRARAEAALRRMALAATGRDGRGLDSALRRHLPGLPEAPAVYVNVGHSNLRPRLWQNLRGLRRLALIHDTIPLDHPEFTRAGQSERFRQRFCVAAGQADLVLTISGAVRADVLRWRERLGLPGAAPVSAIPIGTRLPAEGKAPADIATDRPFFIALGTIEPRKNHALLLDAWQELARRLPPEKMPRLYIIGRRGWENRDVFARLDALAPDAPIRELPGLGDGAVAWLMARSHALLMPSRAEGFGLPLTEAAGRGIPVLSVPLPAAREILGDYARWLPPDDPQAWADALAGLSRGQAVRMQPLVIRDWDSYFADVATFLASALHAVPSGSNS